MNASKFVAVSTLALLAAVTSVAAQADDIERSQYIPSVTSERTRAEVRTEAMAAVGDRTQELAALGPNRRTAQADRADVRADAARALRQNQISSGEVTSM